jgi:hypothetical protein
MATIANLAVMLSANATALESGLARAAKSVTSFAGSLTGLATGVGLGLVINDAIKSADALVHLSNEAKKVGLSFAEMFVIEKFAGGQSEAFTHSLMHLNAQLGKLTAGSDEATQRFAQFGIDANKLLGLTEFERIRALMEAIRGMSPETRAAFSMEAFGKGGQEAINVWMKGAAALDQMNDRLQRFNNLAGLEETTEKWKQQRRQLQELEERMNAVTTKTKFGVMEFLAEGWEGWKIMLGLAKPPGVEDVMQMVRNRPVPDISIDRRMAALLKGQKEFLDVFAKEERVLQGNIFERWAKGLDLLAQAHATGKLSMQEFTKQFDLLNSKLNDSIFGRGQEIFAQTRNPLEKFQADMDEADKLLARGAITEDTFARRFLQIVDSADKLHKMQLPSLMDVTSPEGARAAHAFIRDQEFGAGGESVQEKIRRVLEQLRGEAATSRIAIEEIVRMLQGASGILPANLGGA